MSAPVDAPKAASKISEVDLHQTRSRLATHRRQSLGPQFMARLRHRPLDRPKAHPDVLLGGKLLADHIGIARIAAEPSSTHAFQPSSAFARRGVEGMRHTPLSAIVVRSSWSTRVPP